MGTPTDRPPPGWAGYVAGFGTVMVGAVAVYGLLRGLVTQVTLFGEYESLVDAELNRRLILPCLVATVAVVGAGILWRSAFAQNRAPQWSVLPCLGVALGALVVAGLLIPPSEGELEARWIARLEQLQLPAEFTPVLQDPAEWPGRYEAVRQWQTRQTTDQVCRAVQLAMQEWLGSVPVQRAKHIEECYLTAADGKDVVSAFFFQRDDVPGPKLLQVRMAYAL